jgi:hypothetical protein
MTLDLQIDAIGLPALILNLPQTASNITINGSGNLEGYMKKKIADFSLTNIRILCIN